MRPAGIETIFTVTVTMSVVATLSTQLIAISVISLQRQIEHNRNVNRTMFNLSYDYVVIGSGASGAVVANRLAANPNLQVLLLEAGGPLNVITDAPALAPALVNSEVDWQYVTEPQVNIGQGFPGARIHQPKGTKRVNRFHSSLFVFLDFSGKVLGGTSSINWMLYNRG